MMSNGMLSSIVATPRDIGRTQIGQCWAWSPRRKQRSKVCPINDEIPIKVGPNNSHEGE